MKTPDLQQLTHAARALPDDLRVPFAFEKRLMTLIRDCKPVDTWELWSNTMWRAALTCVVISLLTGALAQFKDESGAQAELLAADLEQAVLAPITPDETW